jgi:NAD(P)-dependent dehydrogenase (short-subunit alcohol dehydrogenase family)
MMSLTGKTILITGAARRLGKIFALAAAKSGANIFLHHSSSPIEAQITASEIRSIGIQAWVLQADFSNPAQTSSLVDQAWSIQPFDALVNNSAIFEPLNVEQTSLSDWQRHMDINLTAPFLLSQAFAAHLPASSTGRIVNILDWRALRPSADHFPYTISKAGLAALTHSMAVAFAPRITVNGLALGAILTPSDGMQTEAILKSVPAQRWADLDEVAQALLFLLDGPGFITGEIIHLDGGRHLV